MSIRYIENKNIFSLEGMNTQYVFGVDNNGILRHLYWGEKIGEISDFEIEEIKEISSNDPVFEITSEEYSVWGGLRYKDPAIKATFKDGTRDIVLSYEGYKIEGGVLNISFKDEHYPLRLVLNYEMLEDVDILKRWTTVENLGLENIKIEAINSAEFNFKEDKFYLTNVTGHWAAEQQQFREKLTPGKKVLESRKGNTGHGNSPYFILDKNATEDNGEVYFGALAHTGNFKVVTEVTAYGTTRVLLGINDFDFEINLKSKEQFNTPEVYAGYTSKGFTDMTHRLNDMAKAYIMPKENVNKIRPVLYNSWEATYFDVKCDEQIKLAEKAAEMGVELFVVDDGWFGERNSDKAGLGDWDINKEKFPQGLKPLIDKVNSLGMDFGIWVEPEMVNPDSELYRNHPDWVYNFKNRQCNTSRNQLVLDLTNEEVVNYIIRFMDELLSENNVKFIKWDMNRPFSEPGALTLALEDQKSIWLKHTEAVYNIVDTLRKKHPQVCFEACASGGGRVDYGSLKHFDQYWTSDNTDALDRINIQEAYSYIYPIKAMRAWVTDCPNFLDKRIIPMEFRFDCAMMGTLGIGGDLNKWSEADRQLAEKKISQYKEIRSIVQEGKLYRLNSLKKHNIAAVQYVLEEKESVVFVLIRSEQYGQEVYNIKLKGLKKDSVYEVKYSVKTFEKVGESYGIKYEDRILKKSGQYLMKMGIDLQLKGDYDSTVIKIKEI